MKTIGHWGRILGIGAAVFVLFAVVVGIAGAQRPDGGQPGPGRGDGPRGQRGELREEFVAALAANLGLPEQTVKDALAKTREDMRPQLEERFQQLRQRFQERAQNPDAGERRGELRQRLQERFQNGAGPRPFDGPARQDVGPGFGFGVGPGGGMGFGFLQTAADVLGMTPDALRQELQQGMTLAQIAQEHGVDPSALGDQLASRIDQQRSQVIHEAIDRMLNQPLNRGGQPQQ